MKFREVCISFLALMVFSFVLFSPSVLAATSTQDTIELVKQPLQNIYDLIKGLVSIIALLVITGGAVMFMVAGNNFQMRDTAKGMLTFAIAGMALVWIAPFIVNFMTVV